MPIKMVLTPYWSEAGQLTLWPTGHKACQTNKRCVCPIDQLHQWVKDQLGFFLGSSSTKHPRMHENLCAISAIKKDITRICGSSSEELATLWPSILAN